MTVYILTSYYHNGFDSVLSKRLNEIITIRKVFTYIASDFVEDRNKSNEYCDEFVEMFKKAGILFEKVNIIDARLSKEEAKIAVKEADVVWLTGGWPPTQLKYLKDYDLIDLIKTHTGVIFGMSAGSINLTTNSLSSSSGKIEVWEGIQCLDISLIPHFFIEKVNDEFISISKQYLVYGLSDDSTIISINNHLEFIGNVYKIENNKVKQISCFQ